MADPKKTDAPAAPAAPDAPATGPPALSPLAIYLLFLRFGAQAFGGPVVQIAMQKDELVTRQGWMSEGKFKRVFALYSVLPGPEATELACYFGRLAGGRLGGVMGGLGFITPGLLLMLLFSWFYQRYGLINKVFLAVFAGLQPAVCAMVLRACHKISDSAFRSHATGAWDWGLAGVGAAAAFLSVLNVNYFIAKAHLLVFYYCYARWEEAAAAAAAAAAAPAPADAAAAAAEAGAAGSGAAAVEGAAPPAPLAPAPPRLLPTPVLLWAAAAAFWTVAPTLVYIGAIGAYGRLDELVPMGVGVAARLGNTHGAQFVVGLLGGLVTFGGAYTAVPFVQYEAVTSGGWVASGAFLDALAVANVLPTPLVMFITMIGYLSGAAMPGGSQLTGLWGALLMTLGMFLPAFAFPVCFHDSLEAVMAQKGLTAKVLDSVAATVVGQIFVTALQLLRSAVVSPLQAVVFFAAMQTVYNLPHRFTPVLVVFCAALAGVVLFY